MKISYNWLKEYVDFEQSPEKLADDLSLFGHEVESINKIGADNILDFEITPNRGDCLSILGMAREISALYDIKIKSKKTLILRSIKESDGKLDKKLDIKIESLEICPRFTARIIDNIEVKESPDWIKTKLATFGFRPINNIVDITNLVMIETGQPLHAFDYDKIKDGLMNIRKSRKGEEVTTLDGVKRVLPNGAIIIEDTEKTYDLAGIMGGQMSEVDENTKTIVLQGAIFDPVLIRRASKYLKHTTDASYRYERGVDYKGTIFGVDLAAQLIQESCEDAKVGELIDIKSQTLELNKIDLDIEKVDKLIGIEIDQEKAKEYLERLKFQVEGNVVTVPSYRALDVKIWQDLAEEIARVYGYNNIKKSPITNDQSPKNNIDWQKREYIKDQLVKMGFVEVYSYSFADKDKIELLGFDIKNCVEIANPLSPETQFLRPSILPSLLVQAAKNPWAPDVNLFEIEKVFESPVNGSEKWELGIITLGKSDKMISTALQGLNLQVQIKKVEQNILDAYKIRRPAYFAIIEVDDIKIAPQNINDEIPASKYRSISRFAPTVRDIALVLDNEINTDSIKQEIYAVDNKILIVELFDEFQSDKIGAGKKNVAFHIWLQDLEKPMDEIITNEIFEKIIQKLENKFQAKLRG